MKLTEVEKLLTQHGYSLDRVNKHRIWSKVGQPHIAIPNHKHVNKMLLKRVLKLLECLTNL